MESNELTVNKEIEQGISDIKTQALSLQVIDTPTYEQAGEMLKAHNAMEKTIKTFFQPHKENTYKAWKGMCNAENEEIAKLLPGKAHLSKEMSNYHQEQERLRKIEEERLRQIAIKKEEDEKIRLAGIAEKEGNKEEAEAILSEETHLPPPIVQSTTPKVSGLGMRVTWKHKVTNIRALIKDVHEGKAPINAIQANDMFLGQQARSLKGTVKYEGVQFYEDKKMGGVRS